uniref:Uncharacterized protein n=1 Tax=Arundo donax TaxID=35708 RepID=A0A0A9C2N8_ARUDO
MYILVVNMIKRHFFTLLCPKME